MPIGLIESLYNTYNDKEKNYLENYLKSLYNQDNPDYDKAAIEVQAIAKFHFSTI